MITQEQAEAVTRKVIDEPDPYCPDRPPHVITKVEAHRLGWLFYYQSHEYIRTGSPSAMLAGNGPVLVSRADGSHVQVGTTAPFERRLVEAEVCVRSGHTVGIEVVDA
jgi:hypothetical protein